MSIDINVPTLGESVSDATIARWIKKAGDAVAADEPIVELETDKVTLEVPSPVAGKLGEIIAAEGETVEVGALLARVEEGAAGAKPAPKQQAPKQEAPKSAPARIAPQAPEKTAGRQRKSRASQYVSCAPKQPFNIAEPQLDIGGAAMVALA